ncbi:MAG: efflux RND transporter periplasmic adaptor subunit [Ferruginibacter sp.]
MKNIIFYSVCTTLLLNLAACEKKEQSAPKANVAIADSIIRNLKTAKATLSDAPEDIRLNGVVSPDESRQVKVYALVSGKINNLSVELGDYVKKGQQLAVLQSTEAAGAANDLSLAESNVAIAKKSMESTKDLFKTNLATERDYISTELEYNKALSELNRARQVAAITGGKGPYHSITAPISGYIIDKQVTANSQVRADNSSNLFTIADLSKVWIMANVYESDIPAMKVGVEVKVTTLANPNEVHTGRIDKVYNVLDPATRTMKVRISMDNPQLELKPEMFATVMVHTLPGNKMLSIPAAALVMENSSHYVILKQGNQLSVKEVKLIRRAGDTAYVEGIAANDEVVINNEVFLYQALTAE